MDEHHICIAAPADIESLPGTDRDDAYFDAGFLPEDGKQVTEQARLLGRGGGSNGYEILLCFC